MTWSMVGSMAVGLGGLVLFLLWAFKEHDFDETRHLPQDHTRRS